MDLQSTAAHRNAKRLARVGRHLLRDLAQVREDRQISKTEVAGNIGIHRSGITRFESPDANPRLDTILRYAHSVGATIIINVIRAEQYEDGLRAFRSGTWVSDEDDGSAIEPMTRQSSGKIRFAI